MLQARAIVQPAALVEAAKRRGPEAGYHPRRQRVRTGTEEVEKLMPYLHLDLPGKFQTAQKRELAVRLCRLYADVMQTQTWRPNIGIAELGEDNLFHLGADGLEPIVMVLVEFRAGRPSEYRLKLADGIVDACVDVLKVPRKWVLVEFTPHVGEEIYRDGNWVADWTPEEGAPVPAT